LVKELGRRKNFIRGRKQILDKDENKWNIGNTKRKPLNIIIKWADSKILIFIIGIGKRYLAI
jgi:hypothetical protein